MLFTFHGNIPELLTGVFPGAVSRGEMAAGLDPQGEVPTGATSVFLESVS